MLSLRYIRDNIKPNSLNMYFIILQKVLERHLGEKDSGTEQGSVVHVHLIKAVTERGGIIPLILNFGSRR